MSTLGSALLWMALQVTILALAAIVVSITLPRRTPALTARLLALALVASVFLAGLAFSPVPSAWNWWTAGKSTLAATASVDGPPPGDGEVETRSPVNGQRTTDPNVPANIPAGDFSRVWRLLRATLAPVQPSSERWTTWLFLAFVSGVVANLGWLLLGTRAVNRCRRRSNPIADLELLQLRDEVGAAVGLARPTELRESLDLTSPATVGWLHPVVLLPADWRMWTVEERRAVLAHELAHVYRHDYFTGLLARVALVLHFYHPLFYWLVARLRLQQELAADALAATHAGGPTKYLRALASLALRQDGRCEDAPTFAFLSSPGTLLRRIAMLRATDGRPLRLLPGVQAAGFILLTAVALSVSTLRAPAEKPVIETPPTSAAKSVESPANAPLEPFDLSYVDLDADMVLAARPAALFGRPEMKLYAELVNKALSEWQLLGKPAASDQLKIEDIDQVIAFGAFKTDKSQKGRQTALLLTTLVVRTVHEFDWKKMLEARDVNLKSIELEGKTCYQPSNPEQGVFLGFPELTLMPDGRTVVIGPKDGLAKLLRSRREKAAPPAWLMDWKQVERGLFAEAETNVAPLVEREPDEATPPEVLTVCRNISSFVVGVEWNNGPVCTLVTRSATEHEAESTVTAMKAALDWGRKQLKLSEASVNKAQIPALTILESLLANDDVRRDGTTVYWRGSAKAEFSELIQALASGDKEH